MFAVMCKNNGKGDTTAAVTSPTPGTGKSTQPLIKSITCYKCGNLRHYSTSCPELQTNVRRKKEEDR